MAGGNEKFIEMKEQYIIYMLLFFFKIVLSQETNIVRKQNDYGFKIVNIGNKYAIKDSLDNYALKDTFELISLGSINSWGKKRNSFVCKKVDKSYLISFDCQGIFEFDSIRIIAGGNYICIDDNKYSLMNDGF